LLYYAIRLNLLLDYERQVFKMVNCIKETNGKWFRYEMHKNNDMPGYRIEKRDLQTGELLDCLYGASEYSLEYYFYNPEVRYTDHKNF